MGSNTGLVGVVDWHDDDDDDDDDPSSAGVRFWCWDLWLQGRTSFLGFRCLASNIFLVVVLSTGGKETIEYGHARIDTDIDLGGQTERGTDGRTAPGRRTCPQHPRPPPWFSWMRMASTSTTGSGRNQDGLTQQRMILGSLTAKARRKRSPTKFINQKIDIYSKIGLWMVHGVLQRTSLPVVYFKPGFIYYILYEGGLYKWCFSPFGRHGLGWLRPSDEEVKIYCFCLRQILVLGKVMNVVACGDVSGSSTFANLKGPDISKRG